MKDYTDMDTLSLKLEEIAEDEAKLEALARMTSYIPGELKKNLFYFRFLVEDGKIPRKATWIH